MRMYRVFLIDDEAWALISLERLIPWEQFGFTVCQKADNARIAWEKICQDPPDVVITDIRMPGMSGLDLLERLRKNEMDVSVILVSGFAEFKYAQEAIHHGAFEYLLKQISREQLTDCMKRLYQVLSEKKKEILELTWRDMQQKNAVQAAGMLLERQGKEQKEFAQYFVCVCRKRKESEEFLSLPMEKTGAVLFPLGKDGQDVWIFGLSDRSGLPPQQLLKMCFMSSGSAGEDCCIWGFSRSGNRETGMSDLIWEARNALAAACFIGKPEIAYHQRENRWKGWDELVRFIRYRQNVLVQEYLSSLKAAVKVGDILPDELFLLCEKMDYEYRKANEGKALIPGKWTNGIDLTEAFPDCETFFSWLCGCFPVSEEEGITEYILCRIEEHLKAPMTLAAIGKELCMSQSALSQILKKNTGKTYSELLQEKRMEKARELLAYTRKTMVEIAEETGYADQFYFSKTFKKSHGISPNEYRKRNKN